MDFTGLREGYKLPAPVLLRGFQLVHFVVPAVMAEKKSSKKGGVKIKLKIPDGCFSYSCYCCGGGIYDTTKQ